MAGHQKDPLRPLTADERTALDQLSRSCTDPAAQVIRAKELLAVATGRSFETVAHAAGRRSGDAVAHLVTRFNRDGVAAAVERHGGGTAGPVGPESPCAAGGEPILVLRAVEPARGDAE